MKLKRYEGNPILSPHPTNAWEDLAVFNPAAWYDAEAGEVLLLYRAAESHPEYKCYFGLATSCDGYHFERTSDEPVFCPSSDAFDGSTIQDPRIIKMGDWYYITYAAGLAGPVSRRRRGPLLSDRRHVVGLSADLPGLTRNTRVREYPTAAHRQREGLRCHCTGSTSRSLSVTSCW